MKQVTRRGNNVGDKTYTVVLDMNNIMKISTVNQQLNSNGENYGMVYMSLKIIGDILNKKDFNYCIAAYDGVGSGYLRYVHYKDYKANRGKNYALHDPNMSEYDKKMLLYQKKVIEYSKKKRYDEAKYKESEDDAFERQKYVLQSILEELCVRQYEFENVEGDDIISYYVKNKKENENVVIVSSDKDLTQLISETVVVYNPRLKDFVTKDNSIEKIGITHENVVLEKILCGDSSDNIKGIKGMGEQTLMKYFPEIKSEKLELDSIINRSKELLEERKNNKKKPLMVLENIVNGVTEGCHKGKVYEINKKIIDLSEPMMTKEAEEELKEVLYAPMDVTDRNYNNIYRIISENKMDSLTDENKFGNLLAPYSRIIMMETRRFKNSKS